MNWRSLFGRSIFEVFAAPSICRGECSRRVPEEKLPFIPLLNIICYFGIIVLLIFLYIEF